MLFIFYLVLFCWLLTKSRFINGAGISTKIIIGLFLLKVLMGCLHPLVLQGTSGMFDTTVFQWEGLLEYHLLWQDPKAYFTNLFYSPYADGYGGVFSSSHSYWNNLKDNLIIKLISVCNIFSLGYYVVNIVFFNYVAFFGAIALYRVFKTVYPKKDGLLIAGCFLLPSLLFFTSAINKEVLLFAALGMAVFTIHSILQFGVSFKKIAYCLMVLIFIFLQRNYMLFAFLPGTIAWVLVHKKKYRAIHTFVITYLVAGAIFFTTGFISAELNFPQAIVNKQIAFIQLEPGHTNLRLRLLEPNMESFLSNLPQAISHALLRPFLTDVHFAPGLLPLVMELLAYELLFLLSICFRENKKGVNPFILFSLFFAGSVLLLIGYIVPAIGAVARYRAIYLPFIITPLLASTDWKKLSSFINNKRI